MTDNMVVLEPYLSNVIYEWEVVLKDKTLLYYIGQTIQELFKRIRQEVTRERLGANMKALGELVDSVTVKPVYRYKNDKRGLETMLDIKETEFTVKRLRNGDTILNSVNSKLLIDIKKKRHYADLIQNGVNVKDFR